jgi:hypothetical protein
MELDSKFELVPKVFGIEKCVQIGTKWFRSWKN